MLHAKELRYGNKVQDQDGEVITVQQILSNALVYDTQVKVHREVASVRGSLRAAYATQYVEVVKEAGFQEIDPIVLTSNVLEKCGFRNYIREEWILSLGNSHIDFEFTDDGLCLRQQVPSQVRIKYLHQLQNFLFAVTGQELEAKL